MKHHNEVFLVILSSEGTTIEDVEMIVCDTIDDVNDTLINESSGNIEMDTIKIYHGVLLNSTFIPNSFDGCTPYIIVFDGNNNNTTISDIINKFPEF